MNLVDEMKKLQELHQNGALTDAEFTSAKQALLASYPATPPGSASAAQPPTVIRFSVPWKLVICIVVLLVAFFSNPDVNSLKQTVGQRLSSSSPRNKESVTDKILSRVADHAIQQTAKYERQSYGLFSIATVTIGVPVVGPSVKVHYFGVFGCWWG